MKLIKITENYSISESEYRSIERNFRVCNLNISEAELEMRVIENIKQNIVSFNIKNNGRNK